MDVVALLAIKEINVKWENQLYLMREDFEKQISTLKSSSEAKISKSEAQACRANEEWQTVEYELKTSREEVWSDNYFLMTF